MPTQGFMSFFRRPQRHERKALVEPLTVERAAHLRSTLFGRNSVAGLVKQVAYYPSLAWTVRDSEQVAIGGHWRRRPEIGEVLQVSPGSNRQALLRRLLQSFEEAGVELVVLDFAEQSAGGSFYRDQGFVHIDRIIEYEARLIESPSQPIVSSIRPYQDSDLDEVLDLEREAFPWLWWNSADELRAYSETPEVEVHVAIEGSKVIGYVGFTVKGTAGHLDRLSVRPSYQARGYGRALVELSLLRMAAYGVSRISLSTQETNYRSQRLYERLGFRRNRWTYEIMGLWIDRPREANT